MKERKNYATVIKEKGNSEEKHHGAVPRRDALLMLYQTEKFKTDSTECTI